MHWAVLAHQESTLTFIQQVFTEDLICARPLGFISKTNRLCFCHSVRLTLWCVCVCV